MVLVCRACTSIVGSAVVGICRESRYSDSVDDDDAGNGVVRLFNTCTLPVSCE